MKKRGVLQVAGALALVLIPSSSAHAIPAFARKYNLNCNACHTREPRLNTFGERFLENGYRLPGTTGLKGTTRLGQVDLADVTDYVAVRALGNFALATSDDGPEGNGFEFRFPRSVTAYFAGPLSSHVSAWAELESNVAEGETGIERAFVTVNRIGNSFLNVRVGRFDPAAFSSYPTHRQLILPLPPQIDDELTEAGVLAGAIERIPLLPNAFSSKFFGLNLEEEGELLLPLAPVLYNSPATIGASIYGRPFGDTFLFDVGVLNNGAGGETFGDDNRSKDFYVMGRVDLSRSHHRAISASAFYYVSNDSVWTAQPVTGQTFTRTDWQRFGLMGNLRWKALDAYGTVVWDRLDDPPAVRLMGEFPFDDDAWGLTLQADYLFTHAVLVSARYDHMTPGGWTNLTRDNDWLSAQVKYYWADNIGFFVRGDSNLDEEIAHPLRRFRRAFQTGIDFAF